MRRTLYMLLLTVACSPAAAPVDKVSVPASEVRDDLRILYDSLQVSGSFIMHDVGRDHWFYIDSSQADVATLPASTFKLFSSLYGLESGVVKDAEEVFKWDGVDHGRPEVNKDLTLREALKVSAYWVHRDIARRAGGATLKHWLDTVGYGNADTSGGYDRCWVAGNLRITPRQQVAFLERLQRNDLPFSQRNMNIVKEISLQEDTLGYTLYGKTGWALGSDGSTGWFVGWVEKANGTGPYIFANRARTSDTLSTTFGPSRRAISLEVLRRTGVIP
ncbi:MAG: class D beta-lactamase [Flavobacteriales bacterium]|nr:class D beta-lactamase [Flavobacteriales bacterium]